MLDNEHRRQLPDFQKFAGVSLFLGYDYPTTICILTNTRFGSQKYPRKYLIGPFRFMGIVSHDLHQAWRLPQAFVYMQKYL